LNGEQTVLVKRLEEAGFSLRMFLKLDQKAAFEPEWQNHLYTPEEMDGPFGVYADATVLYLSMLIE
jgi:hypothetical protein